MTTWQATIDSELTPILDQCVQLRRHLHRYPEPSGEERETSLLLYTRLGDADLPVRLGPEGLGVLVDLECGDVNGRGMLGLRGDIDALRIQDEKQVGYRSEREGVMHACGHDVHASVVTGALLALKHLADSGALPWPVRVRGVLQPSEETCEGALRMIQAGALQQVEAILAVHVDPTLAAGRVGLREGVLTANCDELLVDIHGRGGHAARPHESRDPITAAAELINSLYLHIPRVTDSQEAVVVTVGKIEGGHHSNVIPEDVRLEGTIRTLEASVRAQAKEHLQRIAASVAMMTGTEIDVAFGVSSPSVVNDPAVVALLERIARDMLGASGVHWIPRPSMGSEDFAFYLQQVPGALIRLGSAGPAARSALHTPRFDVDESCLSVAVRLLVRAVIEWFRPREEISN